MNSGVNVKVVENDDVTRRLNEVANRLSKKYNKKRNINEEFLKPKSPLRKIVSYTLNTLSIVFFCLCLLFCFSAVYNRLHNMPPSVAGYFCMRISSGSMENSGFYKGDGVIVRSVDPRTLKEGDIIAFYSDSAYYANMTLSYGLTKVPNDSIPKTKYSLTINKFFGIQPNKIKAVAARNQMLVFHHIREIYQDATGKRYFKTYGSSNLKNKEGEIEDDNIVFDSYLVQEDMVIGKYNNSKMAKTIASMLNVVSTPFGMLIVLTVPVVILIASLMLNSLKNVQLAFLENDVVEEKRKLTDEICVKNNIGYRMSKKTKYKVLAQAPEDKKLEYINLLWKTDNRPQNIRKYYLRKSIVLRPMQKLRDVNRNCEQMFKDNVEPTKIAKYYEQEKAKIQAEEKRYKNMLREIRQNNKNSKKENPYLDNMLLAEEYPMETLYMKKEQPKQSAKSSAKTKNSTNAKNSTKSTAKKSTQTNVKKATSQTKIDKSSKSAVSKSSKTKAQKQTNTAQTKSAKKTETQKTTKTKK